MRVDRASDRLTGQMWMLLLAWEKVPIVLKLQRSLNVRGDSSLLPLREKRGVLFWVPNNFKYHNQVAVRFGLKEIARPAGSRRVGGAAGRGNGKSFLRNLFFTPCAIIGVSYLDTRSKYDTISYVRYQVLLLLSIYLP